jgi:hypothetical protein
MLTTGRGKERLPAADALNILGQLAYQQHGAQPAGAGQLIIQNYGLLRLALNVAPSLIRFWVTEFEELRPRKSKRGNCLYTFQDIDVFRTIYHLVKERGYTIPGARDMLKQKGPSSRRKST